VTLVPYDDAPAPELVLVEACRTCEAPPGQRCQSPRFRIRLIGVWHATRVEDATARALLTP
jgi:hypothetical protein